MYICDGFMIESRKLYLCVGDVFHENHFFIKEVYTFMMITGASWKCSSRVTDT